MCHLSRQAEREVIILSKRKWERSQGETQLQFLKGTNGMYTCPLMLFYDLDAEAIFPTPWPMPEIWGHCVSSLFPSYKMDCCVGIMDIRRSRVWCFVLFFFLVFPCEIPIHRGDVKLVTFSLGWEDIHISANVFFKLSSKILNVLRLVMILMFILTY